MKAGFVSLGCAKNLVDTEVMLGILRQNGIELTDEPQEAEIIIVNTCAFIQSATEEAITTALNMADYKQGGKCKSLILAGCLVDRYRQQVLDEQQLMDGLPEVDAFLGSGAWARVMDAVNESLAGRRVIFKSDGGVYYDAASSLPSDAANNSSENGLPEYGDKNFLYEAKTPRLLTTPSYTAYVKIAEGCDHRCAFCAIPLIRGKFRSRPWEDIVREVEQLTSQGVKEINLVAQDTTFYGADLYGKPSLAMLLKKLAKVEQVKWLRALYAYPHNFTDELMETIAAEPKICKYVDLPLQHADDAVLRRMRRPDSHQATTELIAKIRAKIPGVSLRTTFIVGFPGETEAEYGVLRDFLREQRFDKVGIFAYSREEDTPAYDMPDQIEEEVAQERYHELMSIQSKISEEVNQSLAGRELDVLVEGRDWREDNIAYGRSYREAPEVDGQIYIEGDSVSAPGDIVRVKISQGFVYDMVGERV